MQNILINFLLLATWFKSPWLHHWHLPPLFFGCDPWEVFYVTIDAQVLNTHDLNMLDASVDLAVAKAAVV